jgi:hypothetical protein
MHEENIEILRSHPYFEYTCPLLLSFEHRLDPFLEVEDFFDSASLRYYTSELRSWFQISLTEDMEIENHSNLIFFHNQLIRLLQAGHFIIENNSKYPSKYYLETAERFKEWVSNKRKEKFDEGTGRAGHYEILFLSDAEIANPLSYLKEILTLSRIAEIRYGLQEWIYCSFNGQSSIGTMEAKYVFNLFEDVEKIIELLFLLIAGDNAEKSSQEGTF